MQAAISLAAAQVAAGVAAHTGSGEIRCGSAYRGLACGPTASGQPHEIRRLGCGSARCRPRCGSHGVGRAHRIQGIHCGPGSVRAGVRRKTLLGFGMAHQVLDTGPARDGSAARPRWRWKGVGGRATRSTVSRGCPKAIVWRRKGRTLARQRHQSQVSAHGSPACSLARPGG
jgi:hypothetical protein